MKRNVNNNGITLIALVVTIIVLLILAGVSISMLTGQNGILNRVAEAKDKSEESETKELIEMAVFNSIIGENGVSKLNKEKLQENISNVLEKDKAVVIDNKNETYTIKLNDTNKKYYIDKNGKIFDCKDRNGIEVGDYIEYKSDNTEKYLVSKEASGHNENQEISTEVLRWRVLNINEGGTIELIPDNATNQKIFFKGTLGYNNGVYIMNDICKKLYGNTKMQVEARSINLIDIENEFTEDGKIKRNLYESKYGTTKTFTNTEKTNYPYIYKYERFSGVDSDTILNEGTERYNSYYNDVTSKTYEHSQKLTVKFVFYNISFYDLCTEKIASIFVTNDAFWVASRYVYYGDNAAFFGLNNASKKFNGDDMYSSGDVEYELGIGLRPIVTLSPNIDIKLCDGENGINNMHKINF